MIETTSNLYRLGWDERNGGKISYLLSKDELIPYLNVNNVVKGVSMTFDATFLAGKYYIVTESGKIISTIVEKEGYDNISYFYRNLKEKYGKTPKEIRDKNDL